MTRDISCNASYGHLNAGFRLKSSCTAPVSTGPHGGQIIVHFTSQHRTTWRSDHRAIHHSAQYHMVVRSSCIAPVSIVPRGSQIIAHFHQSKQNHVAVRSSCFAPVSTGSRGSLIIVLCTCQHRITWRLDHRALHQSA